MRGQEGSIPMAKGGRGFSPQLRVPALPRETCSELNKYLISRPASAFFICTNNPRPLVAALELDYPSSFCSKAKKPTSQ